MPSGPAYLIASSAEGDRALDTILKKPGGISQKYHLSKTQLGDFQQELLAG